MNSELHLSLLVLQAETKQESEGESRTDRKRRHSAEVDVLPIDRPEFDESRVLLDWC